MEILYTETVSETNGMLIFFIFLLGCVFTIGGFIVAFYLKEFPLGMPFAIVGIIFLIVGVLSLFNPRLTTTYYYAIIDDSIPFTEVMEKYDIVEQNGNLFKLKEKEPSNEYIN